MILEGIVTHLHKDPHTSRILSIQAKLTQPLALCHSSDRLYQDHHRVYQGRDPINPLKDTEF